MSAVPQAGPPLVRPMREADLPAVNEVERGAYEFPWSPGIFRDCLRVGYCCWVLEQDGAIKGHGIMQVGPNESHVLNLCVSATDQGQGFGRLLLSRLLRVAGELRRSVRPQGPAVRMVLPRSAARLHQDGRPGGCDQRERDPQGYQGPRRG